MSLEVRGDRADVDGMIERTGLDFQIATRLTSWVAVSEEATVDPGQPTRRERIPQMVPQGLSVDGLGLLKGVVVTNMLSSAAHEEFASRYFSMDDLEPLVDVHGRIALRRGRELVIEITLDCARQWTPLGAVVVWSDGTRSLVSIDRVATTRPGAFQAGQVIRLVLRLKPDAPDSAPTKILMNAGEMSIALDDNP